MARVTLSAVARAAGLSTGGTSYALRGHPSIPADTVRRVREIAAKLGYRPDLRVSSLMAMIRNSRPVTSSETLGFIWINTPKRTERLPIHLQYYARVILAGAKKRAEELGCRIEEFWIDGEMRPARLDRILRARGVTGLVISPAGSDRAVSIEWDWASFASAIIGNTEISPELNRSAHYHYRSVWLALRRLREEGYTRPAAILSASVQERIHNMQLAAFVTNHPTPAIAGDSVRLSQPGEFSSLQHWLRKLRPDSLVLGWQLDPRSAAKLRELAPRAKRIITLEWHPHGVLPGIDPCNDAISAHAVDLVIAQLHRNELGVPSRPITLLLDGIWRER
jgi:LacI family transcriptional regulator